jgi:hypothetical protein
MVVAMMVAMIGGRGNGLTLPAARSVGMPESGLRTFCRRELFDRSRHWLIQPLPCAMRT